MAAILPNTILRFASAMLKLHFSTFTKVDLHVIHNYVTAETVISPQQTKHILNKLIIFNHSFIVTLKLIQQNIFLGFML